MLSPMESMQVQMILAGLRKLAPEKRAEVFREVAKQFCLKCGATAPCMCQGGVR